jgi:hypothetical protein
MPDSERFLDYTGPIDYNTVETLLKSLKKTQEFINLDKTTGKRVYAILVECLENIAKYSVKVPSGDIKTQPVITVRKNNGKIVIQAGNPVTNDRTAELIKRLNQVNYLDEQALNTLYDTRINEETKQEGNGAGLGLMMIKLKSGNEIAYKFTRIDNNYTYYELIIAVNEYIMRKLIIEQTTNSPKVILDPDKKIFEISGESRPPNVPAFYEEIIRWLDGFTLYLSKSSDNTDPVVFNLDFEYFNSSSAKYILDFCKQLANLRTNGKNVVVRWHYEDDDIDMLEVGKEMSRMAKIPFEYVQKGSNN